MSRLCVYSLQYTIKLAGLTPNGDYDMQQSMPFRDSVFNSTSYTSPARIRSKLCSMAVKRCDYYNT
jgi:hypothetical protein